jgi:Flp pilus assembly protein TadG
MKRYHLFLSINNQRGVTLVLVAICIFMIIAFTALAVDIGHLVVTKNELQNAADAGALAGARYLYNDDGTLVNTGCNDIAMTAAEANKSDNIVDAIDVAANDVQRGHWSFTTRTFTPNDATAPVELWDVSTQALDTDTDFINAVRVTAWRRKGMTPGSDDIDPWFAKIFGYQSFVQSATAVAYIGFAGSLGPTDADQPIAICMQSLKENEGDPYQCNIGRMLNSGSNDATNNTAGWTNFTQPCDTASASDMAALVCADGNPGMLNYGEGIGSTGGVQDNVLRDLAQCWRQQADTNEDGQPDKFWPLMLPVVDCPGNNVSNCAELRGAVYVNVVWIEKKANDYRDAPKQMEDWPNNDTLDEFDELVADLEPYFVGEGPNDSFPVFPVGTKVGDQGVFGGDTVESGQVRWASFVKHFELKNADGNYATFAKKSLYFLPDCTPHELVGTTQGENFGVMARIPVLVD